MLKKDANLEFLVKFLRRNSKNQWNLDNFGGKQTKVRQFEFRVWRYLLVVVGFKLCSWVISGRKFPTQEFFVELGVK